MRFASLALVAPLYAVLAVVPAQATVYDLRPLSGTANLALSQFDAAQHLVDNFESAFTNFQVTGQIETDGTFGAITSANFVSATLHVTGSGTFRADGVADPVDFDNLYATSFSVDLTFGPSDVVLNLFATPTELAIPGDFRSRSALAFSRDFFGVPVTATGPTVNSQTTFRLDASRSFDRNDRPIDNLFVRLVEFSNLPEQQTLQTAVTLFTSSPIDPTGAPLVLATAAPSAVVPLPAALPLLATGLAALGALGLRRRRTA